MEPRLNLHLPYCLSFAGADVVGARKGLAMMLQATAFAKLTEFIAYTIKACRNCD